MMARRKESDVAPLRDLELLVLLAAMHLGERAYPLAIRDAIELKAKRKVSRAAVFITLERLEQKGLMTSRYGDPTPVRGGRAKRFFSVRRAGVEAARRSLDSVASLAAGLEGALGAR
jgi:DNA-binding PadR family transcriptional regulator